MLDGGMPAKVLNKAISFGMHNDCLASPSTSCDECLASVFLAFDYYYAGMNDLELAQAIVNDLIKDKVDSA